MAPQCIGKTDRVGISMFLWDAIQIESNWIGETGLDDRLYLLKSIVHWTFCFQCMIFPWSHPDKFRDYDRLWFVTCIF